VSLSDPRWTIGRALKLTLHDDIDAFTKTVGTDRVWLPHQ